METIPLSHIFYIQRLKVPGIIIFSRTKSLKSLLCFHILIVSHRLPKSHAFTQTTIFRYIFDTEYLFFNIFIFPETAHQFGAQPLFEIYFTVTVIALYTPFCAYTHTVQLPFPVALIIPLDVTVATFVLLLS